MRSTGRYSKGAAKREEILDICLELFAQEGYRGTSLREVARRAELSLTGVMHYFDSKEHLLTEVMRRRDEVNAQMWDRADLDPIERLVGVVNHNATVPGLIELYCTLIAAAADPQHPAHDYMAERMITARARVARTVRELQMAGRISADMNPLEIAFSVTSMTDGIQLHWLLDRSIDMAQRVRAACDVYLL